jgi:putative transposase
MPTPINSKAPPPLVVTTLAPVFARLFDREALLREARRLGAVKRDRMLHVWDVLLAMVRCAVGDEHRSVATARRQFFDLTGVMPEESSFYDRLTPAFADLAWQTFLRVLASANRAQRKRVAKALGVHVRDVRVVDASVVTLPDRAKAAFPSTDAKHGGFKLTATLSVLEDLLVSAHITDARRHDRKAFELPADRRGVLWICDRGYSDHTLFAQIADGRGYFLVRLKTSSLPTITAIRSGLAKAHRNKPLTPELPFYGSVDLDARFRVGRTQSRVFRVVGIPVAQLKSGEFGYIWLATNLPDRVAAETVGAFYRLRWAVENLFRVLKSVGRLDELRSGKPAVIRAFIAATLVGWALTQVICAAMRAERRRCEPSEYRVFALLLANLGSLVTAAAAGRRGLRERLAAFRTALWREGVNPNPGRPYARERHLATVEK